MPLKDLQLGQRLADYFDGRCPDCRGTRWVMEDGVAVRCPCFLRDTDGRRKAQTQIPESYQHCTLQNFVPQNTRQSDALSRASQFVRNYEDPSVLGSGLLLRGPVGVGKTHLAVAVLKALVEKGYTGVFFNFVHLFEKIKQSFDPARDEEDPDPLRVLRRCHVVVLDELGASRTSEFIFDKLYDIINTCFDRKISILFTTNFRDLPALPRSDRTHSSDFDSLSELTRPNESLQATQRMHTLTDRITERLRSRILEHCQDIDMEGPDFRQIKRRARTAPSGGTPAVSGPAGKRGAGPKGGSES